MFDLINATFVSFLNHVESGWKTLKFSKYFLTVNDS